MRRGPFISWQHLKCALRIGTTSVGMLCLNGFPNNRCAALIRYSALEGSGIPRI